MQRTAGAKGNHSNGDRMSSPRIRLFLRQQGRRLLTRLDKTRAFSRLSFSQSGEDLIVDYIFQARGVDSPTYVDIGAYHPWLISNTALFYKRGSRGINIEPNPLLFREIAAERPMDINLNIGLSDKEGELDFFVMTPAHLSTFVKQNAEKYVREHSYVIEKVAKIKVDTLRHILEQHFSGTCPDYLSIDTEGLDITVLSSVDFDTFKPKVICVETTTYSKTGHGQKETETTRFLESKGYLLYADTYINSIFVLRNFWVR
ncbi:MAG TPA: FkbM family methyltransferase [Syntrophorhabdales bacterium]|nr:FkbM family methyltransferase [Syntrophorhabdales bacterium]